MTQISLINNPTYFQYCGLNTLKLLLVIKKTGINEQQLVATDAPDFYRLF
jgi:hypothetical protein